MQFLSSTLRFLCLFVALFLAAASPGVCVQAAPEPAPPSSTPELVTPADAAWRAALPRDPAAATDAYLARLTPAAKARSDAYFEGGYWLHLWNLVVGLVVAWVLLASRASARWRDAVERRTRFKFLQAGLFGVGWIAASALLSAPLDIYEGFVREHQYGLATQGFVDWASEQLLAFAINLAIGFVAIGLFYLVLRRAPRRWWAGASVLAIVLIVFGLLVSPVWIDPLFNTYRPLADGPVKASLLAMARANGVPAHDILEFDASRQTTRVSANVSGALGSASIRLNDNLLRRTSPASILAVTGHEMGHYVLNHIEKMIVQLGVLVVLTFAFVAWAFERVHRRFGAAWGLRGVADPAGLPLLAALISVAAFVCTPLMNTLVRTQEIEADSWGINAAREPDAMAEVLLTLVAYRKADPGPWEERLFFDHPSTRNRIFAAMRWKAEQPLPAP